MEETPTADATVADEQPRLDAATLRLATEGLRSQQNLGGAVLGGLLAAVAGAAVWALVTVVTEYQIGWMAVGVGALVGFAVRLLGKGLDKIYGIVGAVLALFGCLLGNVLTIVYFIADAEGVGYFETLTALRPAAIPELLATTFSPMDILFYGIAVYEGYRFAFRLVSDDDLQAAIKRAPAAGVRAP